MMPYYNHAGVTIYCGDALTCLRELPDGLAHCCVTSPPYWGLRDYGTADWEGGDPACNHKAPVTSRSLRPAGGLQCGSATVDAGTVQRDCAKCGATRVDKQIGLERTPDEYVVNLVAVFREVKRVLRDDGTLWLNLGDSYASHPGQRGTNDVAGAKQGTNTGSIGAPSRTAPGIKAKDLVGIPWMVAFALRADGWYLRSEIIWHKPNPMPESVTDRPTKSHEQIFLLAKSERYYYDADAISEPLATAPNSQSRGPKDTPDRGPREGGNTGLRDMALRMRDGDVTSRNKRSVWTVPTAPFTEAHFATFPPALITPCVLAGSSAGGIVIDPFTGAATTALVAKENGRRFIGTELNREYCEMSARRLAQDVLF